MVAIADLASRFEGRLLVEADDTAPFLTDWRRLWTGTALGVAQPASTRDVAEIVRWCAEHRVPIVPQGGNTGMSGGATPDGSGRALVLSLARMNRVRSLDAVNNTVSVDAGCILHDVQQAAAAVDRLFPLSLAAEGSCTIGGNLAANAGGTGVLRYGNARELCLGLEVVTAAGETWDGMRALRKDNSGYDLRDLFIGSEGTLGIITGAVLKLFPAPAGRVVAFVAVASAEAAVALFEQARGRLDTALTAFELISETCLSLVLRHRPGARRPLASEAPWYALVEVSDPGAEERARDGLERTLAAAFEAELILDGVIADSVAQSSALWALREGIAEAQGAEGKTIKHDIAVPISAIPAFLAEADAVIARRWPTLRFVTFGHLGDGNLHYNFSPAAGGGGAAFMAEQGALNQVTHDIATRHGGTVSAEHGLGQLRVEEAARYKSSVEMRLMRTLKDAFDPLGIMNPGKVLA